MTSPQRSLFDPPAARASDPVSSHEAAARASASGTAAEQRQALLQAIRENPGRTSAELGQITGIERHRAARRLPDMRDRLGLVRNGPERKCTVTGAKGSLTWLLVDAPSPPPTRRRTAEPPLPRRKRPQPTTIADLPAEISPPPSPTAADELVTWFRFVSAAGTLPTEPFELRPGERVSNPAMFYAALADDVDAGPTAPYFAQQIANARWQPLLCDLQRLQTLVEETTR